MLFNSLSYAIFLPAVFTLYWSCKDKYRWLILLISSYFFYMSWNPRYVVLIFGTTVVSYLAGIGIERVETRVKKKSILVLSAFVCLGVLFVFKYINFFSESVCSMLQAISIQVHPVTFNLLLPVGISFYTFQTLSYVIDVYRGDVGAERHFGYYATYVSFFPQLVAGPIERSSNLLPQIKSEKRFNYDKSVYGLRMMLIGFFKKIVIADNLAIYVDEVYKNVDAYHGFSLLMVVLFFSLQIYYDFSGYSDIAIGSAKLMGIDLMTNFESPYFSKSVKEFWGRWHISLSSWLRDYIYIPLGGNRVGKARHKINLLITFLASGLWHGANWTYILWGMVHGVAQMLSIKSVNNSDKMIKIPSWLKVCVTFVFCNLAWVLFRAETLHDAFYVYQNMLCGINDGIITYVCDGIKQIDIKKLELIKITVSLSIISVVDYILLNRDVYVLIGEKPKHIRWGLYVIVTLMIIFFMPVTKETQFLYFQF